MEDLSHLRKSYEKNELGDFNLPDDPMQLFKDWFTEVFAIDQQQERNAMTLSTIGLDGYPKSRVVLLKSYDADGFVFFTNYESEKGKAIAQHPEVCLSFFWPDFERQIIIKGTAEKISPMLSDVYFESRPRGSQLGAVASNQSEVVPSREFLDSKLSQLESDFSASKINRPQNWGGYLVKPHEVEFWQGRANRMHDRIRYKCINGVWERNRLSP